MKGASVLHFCRSSAKCEPRMNEAQRENTRTVLKDLFAFWDARGDSYGEVMFCSAAATAFDGTWRSVVSFLLPLKKGDRNPEQTSELADYGHFKLAKGILPMDGARKILSDVVEKDRLCLPSLPDLVIEVSAHPTSSKYLLDSSSRRFPVGFPCYEFAFNIDHNQLGNLPGGPLYHPDLPLFPSGREAIAHFFRAELGDAHNRVSALVPDYRAKIQSVRIGVGTVTVQVVCPSGTSGRDLIGKLYSRSHGAVSDCTDLRFANGTAAAKISDFPRDLLVVLLSTKSGDLIDQRQFLAGSVYRNEDVIIEAPEQDLEQTIQMGECELVEFKRDLSPKREELAISVTSFANLHGGKLLIGVDDDCEIVGCRLEKPKDTITHILRSHCDPPLAVSIQEVSVRGLPVIVVTVPEGPDKPYSVREKGVYIRAQGTTRIASRYELDAMYRSKGNAYGLIDTEFGVP